MNTDIAVTEQRPTQSCRGLAKAICTTREGAAVTVTAHYNNANVVNMIETGHYPMTGVLVYEEE